MVDAVAVAAVALLVIAVVGTVVPMVPGGALSLAGLLLYWWGSGFTEPGLLALAALALLAVLALLVDLFAGASAARYGGASWTTTGAAVVVSIVLFVVTGPVGLLAGLFGTVFVLEFVLGGDVRESSRSAAYATVGVLASTAIQVLLTATILLGFVLSVFVL